MSNEEMKLRLECLKLSYEVNFKIGNLKGSYETPQEINKDLHDVFSLSDMNLEYIIYGRMPLDLEGDIESDSIQKKIL